MSSTTNNKRKKLPINWSVQIKNIADAIMSILSFVQVEVFGEFHTKCRTIRMIQTKKSPIDVYIWLTLHYKQYVDFLIFMLWYGVHLATLNDFTWFVDLHCTYIAIAYMLCKINIFFSLAHYSGPIIQTNTFIILLSLLSSYTGCSQPKDYAHILSNTNRPYNIRNENRSVFDAYRIR